MRFPHQVEQVVWLPGRRAAAPPRFRDPTKGVVGMRTAKVLPGSGASEWDSKTACHVIVLMLPRVVGSQ